MQYRNKNVDANVHRHQNRELKKTCDYSSSPLRLNSDSVNPSRFMERSEVDQGRRNHYIAKTEQYLPRMVQNWCLQGAIKRGPPVQL